MIYGVYLKSEHLLFKKKKDSTWGQPGSHRSESEDFFFKLTDHQMHERENKDDILLIRVEKLGCCTNEEEVIRLLEIKFRFETLRV